MWWNLRRRSLFDRLSLCCPKPLLLAASGCQGSGSWGALLYEGDALLQVARHGTAFRGRPGRIVRHRCVMLFQLQLEDQHASVAHYLMRPGS